MPDTNYQPPAGYVTMAQAAARLRVSMVTLRRVVRDANLATFGDPLNKRVRLLKESDVSELRQVTPEDAKAAA